MEDVAHSGSSGNAPVRNGASWLDFGTLASDGVETQRVWRVSKFTQAPFYRWGFRDWELRGEATTDFVPLPPLDLPTYGINQQPFGMEPAHHLFVRYRSSHAFWETVPRPSTAPEGDPRDLWTQHEILLFTRNPEEQFQFFFDFIKPSDFPNVLAFNARWRQVLTITNPNDPKEPSALVPNAATVLYPPSANWVTLPPNGPLAVFTSEIVQGDFWRNATPAGEGAFPVHGSIKAAAVVNHGICSSFPVALRYSDMFATLDGLLFPKFANLILPRISPGPGNGVVKRFSNYVPFVRASVEAENGQSGGFIANASVQINGLFGGGPNVLVQDAFWFRLVDGRLTVEPQPIFETGAGTGAGDVRTTVADLLTKSMQVGMRPYDPPVTLAQNFWHLADNVQAFRGLALPPAVPAGPPCGGPPLDNTYGTMADPNGCKKDGNGNPIDGPAGCAPGSGYECAGSPRKCRNIEAVPVVAKLTDCGGFVETVRGSVEKAAKNLAGLPQFNFSARDIQELDNTVLETRFDGRLNKTVYKHFRCVPRKAGATTTIDPKNPDYDDTTVARCEYVLPAKRVNALPDGVELVFVDDTRELKNPAFPIWLFLWNLPKSFPALDGLCDPPTFTQPGEKRLRKYDFFNGPGRQWSWDCTNNPCVILEQMWP